MQTLRQQIFPPSNRKIDLRKSKEQMKKYRNPRRRMILTKNKASRLTFPKPPISVNAQNSRSPLCGTMIKRRNLNNQIKRHPVVKYGANLTGTVGTKILVFRQSPGLKFITVFAILLIKPNSRFKVRFIVLQR